MVDTTSTEKLLSACGGSLITSVMVTPMDVVKMRMQTQNSIRTCCMALNNCIHHFFEPCQQQNFKSTFDGIYKISKYEGVSALWKGLSPALVMSVPANVIYFVGYEYLRDFIQPYQFSQKDYSPLIAGSVARTIAVTFISPIELFRTRLQATTHLQTFTDVLDGVKKMVVQDGSRALWRGLPPTLWRDVPFSGIYWMGYEECKQYLDHHSKLNDIEASFLSGALSGMFAAAVTTPFDVAKTRRQVDAGREISTLKESNVPAILKQIYQQEGIRGLFRGLTPRVAKVAPSCAIMISSYEMGKVFFSKHHS